MIDHVYRDAHINMPRVLVFGQRFHLRAGSGITLSNLFSGWDKDKLFSLPVQSGVSSYELCPEIYEMGCENRRVFGLRVSSHLNQESAAKSVDKSLQDTISASGGKDQSTLSLRAARAKLLMVYRFILKLSGLYHFKDTYVLSDSQKKWLDDINVDVIYAQFSTLSGMKYLIEIAQYLNKPIVIHIMDNWILTVVKPCLLYPIIKKRYSALFKRVLSLSAVRIAISESMAEEYQQLYGYPFEWLHNPIDPNQWNNIEINNAGTEVIIGYFGGIGLRSRHSVEDVARAVDMIGSPTIKMRVFTNDSNMLPASFNNFKNVDIFPTVPFSQYQIEIMKCSLLVIPFGFSKDSGNFTKLSIPTKLSEFMISKIPIIVYAPPETALFKFCDRHLCATLIGKRNVGKLRECIKQFTSNPESFYELSDNAYNVAVSTMSKDAMQARLLKILITASGC